MIYYVIYLTTYLFNGHKNVKVGFGSATVNQDSKELFTDPQHCPKHFLKQTEKYGYPHIRFWRIIWHKFDLDLGIFKKI